MHSGKLAILLLILPVLAGSVSAAPAAEYFAGQDLHLSADEMTVYGGNGLADDRHVLLFEGDFRLSIGANDLSSEQAIVWIDTLRTVHQGVEQVDYNAKIYLKGNVSVTRGEGAKSTAMRQAVIEQGHSLVTSFKVTGEVYSKADVQYQARLRELKGTELYNEAISAADPVVLRPRIAEEAKIPGDVDPATVEDVDQHRMRDEMAVVDESADQVPAGEKSEAGQKQVQRETEPISDVYQYPIQIAAVGSEQPRIETSKLPSGMNIATIRGRFYMWQRSEDGEGLLEFQADNAVIFYSGENFSVAGDDASGDSLGSGRAEAVYVQGDIIMTEGPRTIRAEEVYYDFRFRRAIAVRAEMQQYDVDRGIPVYLRAAKLKKVTDNVFEAEDITLTTSEFYLPQVSMTASSLVLTDMTSVDERASREETESKYDAVLYDTRMKYKTATIFAWPKIRTDFERPDVPIRRASVGDSSDFGFSVETNWYLSKLLGIKEPEGVETDLAVDYYGQRGLGTGVAAEYERQDYYGWVSSYVIKDSGEDDLGRINSRENLEPESDWRGRFTARHRHYLPYDWQATVEVSYLSDKNFLESFYRDEFDNGKAQETLLYLKRLKENWAFSILNKVRINDWATETEELPTVEYHKLGESFWDHRLTYYSDTQVSRLKDRYSSDSSQQSPEQFYTFASTRHEVDAPLTVGQWQVVPFAAGTFGYEDQGGFIRNIDGTPGNREDTVWLGETGVRASTMLWNVDPTVKSEFWDLDGMRHIVQPHIEAAGYYDSDDVFEMRDYVNLGLSQRWQTHRGTEEFERTVNWMRLDLNATFLSETADDPVGPDKYIYNNPAVPVFARRRSVDFGLQRDMINADYSWRMSDVSTLLSDLSYDIDAGTVEQFDLGFVRYVYPDLSYYIGNRYLKRVTVDVPADDIFEEGSNSLIAAVTYNLNDRYTAVISQEYNFDYGHNVRSELTLIRRYHRLYYGFTFEIDESRDEQSVMFSVWPQGVDDLAIGSRDYVGITETIPQI
ncbi:LPS-assembly protein LptD [Anaerohalosphaera lusitana]|nr:LPS-assembly protein LptD [Anaerohalosphaera lusitana]